MRETVKTDTAMCFAFNKQISFRFLNSVKLLFKLLEKFPDGTGHSTE